jgi:hypothetical protein
MKTASGCVASRSSMGIGFSLCDTSSQTSATAQTQVGRDCPVLEKGIISFFAQSSGTQTNIAALKQVEESVGTRRASQRRLLADRFDDPGWMGQDPVKKYIQSLLAYIHWSLGELTTMDKVTYILKYAGNHHSQ